MISDNYKSSRILDLCVMWIWFFSYFLDAGSEPISSHKIAEAYFYQHISTVIKEWLCNYTRHFNTDIINYPFFGEYSDVIRGTVATQITILTIVYSTVCSGSD